MELGFRSGEIRQDVTIERSSEQVDKSMQEVKVIPKTNFSLEVHGTEIGLAGAIKL